MRSPFITSCFSATHFKGLSHDIFDLFSNSSIQTPTYGWSTFNTFFNPSRYWHSKVSKIFKDAPLRDNRGVSEQIHEKPTKKTKMREKNRRHKNKSILFKTLCDAYYKTLFSLQPDRTNGYCMVYIVHTLPQLCIFVIFKVAFSVVISYNGK